MSDEPSGEDNWREKLTPEQYEILRNKGTEAPFSGEYVHPGKNGMYVCAACGQELFSSDSQFDSGSGWPSFYEAVADDRVKLVPDDSGGMQRTEVTCANCGSHLGHVFDDGPKPRNMRYCINSLALDLKKDGS